MTSERAWDEAAKKLAQALRESEDRRILMEMQPWDPPKEALRSASGAAPEDHLWELAGTKADRETPTTYFLWGCRKCGRRVVTEAATKDGECMADQSAPDSQSLRRGNVDEDCLQAMVDGVSRR